MKRAILLVLVFGLAAACDDISNPPERPVAVTATVEGAGPIGAVLLSVEGTADSVTVTGGQGVVSSQGGLTYVVAVLGSPAPTATVGLRVRGEAIASIAVVQVADGENAPYDDPGAFTVTTREE